MFSLYKLYLECQSRIVRGVRGARDHIMIIFVQVKIEGLPGQDYRSDIAIDDISSSDYTNKCKRKTITNHQPIPDTLNLAFLKSPLS